MQPKPRTGYYNKYSIHSDYKEELLQMKNIVKNENWIDEFSRRLLREDLDNCWEWSWIVIKHIKKYEANENITPGKTKCAGKE